MYRLWIIHYAFVKGIYKKKRVLTNSSASALTTFCTVSLLLFIIAIVIDKDILWGIIDRNLPLGPMIKWLGLLLFFILIPFFKPKLTARKIKYIRSIIIYVQRTKRIYFILYVIFYLILFAIALSIPVIFRV